MFKIFKCYYNFRQNSYTLFFFTEDIPLCHKTERKQTSL